MTDERPVRRIGIHPHIVTIFYAKLFGIVGVDVHFLFTDPRGARVTPVRVAEVT